MNKSLLLLLGISAGFGLSASLVSFPAAAQPITYMLSDATATFAQGTVDLTGTFTFDPTSITLDSADITATGPTPIPLSTSPTTFIQPFSVITEDTIRANNAVSGPGAAAIALFFQDPLSNSVDPLRFVNPSDA